MTPENWLQKKWRPITAIVYLVICVFDFIVAPVLWAIFLVITDNAEKSMMWDPLTLKGAGMFHLSFGAILGVSAFTRGQEKIAKVNTGYEETNKE
jgi:hypothetical protein